MASIPITEAASMSGTQPPMMRIFEAALQTFLAGVPAQIDGAGDIQEWDGATVLAGIVGIAQERASNLAVAGVAQTMTFGSVPNQALAVNIPRGAPINDGRCGINVAGFGTIFHGQVGPAQVHAESDVGVSYGMTKDVDGYWYVDKLKVGPDAVVRVIATDPWDTRGVYFTFLPSAVQLAP